jgi:3-methyladenine DNA glycosylase/8-oxoguanine DNA glycosylase
MARLIERIGPIKLRARRVPVFQSLVQAIIYQQLSGKAADTILSRFLGLFGDVFPSPAQVLAITPEQLRSAGLSKPKAKYVRGVAERAVDALHSGFAILDIPEPAGPAEDPEFVGHVVAHSCEATTGRFPSVSHG